MPVAALSILVAVLLSNACSHVWANTISFTASGASLLLNQPSGIIGSNPFIPFPTIGTARHVQSGTGVTIISLPASTSSLFVGTLPATTSGLNIVQPSIVVFQPSIGTVQPSIGSLQPSIGQPTFLLNTGQTPSFLGSTNAVTTTIGGVNVVLTPPSVLATTSPFLIFAGQSALPTSTAVFATLSPDNLMGTRESSPDPSLLVNPEPASLLLFASGLLGLAALRRKRRKDTVSLNR